jgi:hypothetical protein
MADPVLRRNFRSLSVKDLLDARDQYHVHISRRDNVVGTAIGLYRIRKRDPDARDANAPHQKGRREPRTLVNTVVRPWSWPCVMVFVDKWRPLAEMRRHPEEIVPSFLYLPDGRVAPTCVIYAPRDERAHPPITRLTFPRGAIGGGYPVITDVQGNEHVGSIGCLVTNGDVVYALTSRHVVGEPGRPVYTIVHGERKRIGESDRDQATKRPFEDVYPGLAGAHSFTNFDAGLIRVDDLRGWTAQVFGLGQFGPLVNIHAANISMDLVGAPVRAFGAASGPMTGQIMGLFYRYRTVGGADFVADFLIGPREDDPQPLRTRPGDSGTIWCWDPQPVDEPRALDQPRAAVVTPVERPATSKVVQTLRPFGAQWGGQVLLGADGKEPTQFALATNLSQICRALDVDLVRDWGTGLSEYWGKVGHYKVGSKACELVRSAKLRTLLMANQDRIGVSDADLVAGKLPMNNQPEFVALADVADLVWRAKRKKDAANHFADMDEEGTGPFAGRTLMTLWFDDPASRTPAVWTQFYSSLSADLPDKHRGALPFRVAEIYEAMVGFVRAKDVSKFVCAAGLLAHYVGDACQPLHVSKLHHGRPGHDEDDVHSVFETAMLDRRAVELVDGVNTTVGQKKAPATSLKGGAAAAHATVELMRKTFTLIAPMEVIDAYNAEEGRRRIEHMWDVLGKRTCKTIANGALTLAHLWQSAWVEGQGHKIPSSKLKAVSKTTLRNLYMDPSFLRANWLKDM